MENKNMHCDPVTGICEVPAVMENTTAVMETIHTQKSSKPVRLLYFTDPICSSCWGIEPQMRRLKLEYGDYFDVEYRMGGLLKGWDSYGGSDVAKPTDVAQHWDEASAYYNMPIDGDVWIEDPLSSSYPPSIGYKAAQMQDAVKAEKFLRRIKEMVFIEKKNITKWEHLSQAALDTGLNLEKFRDDFDHDAKELFNEDLELARQFGVRGFPTIFFIDEDDNRFKVYGSKLYEQYESALLKLVPDAVKKEVPLNVNDYFDRYNTITVQELADLQNINLPEAKDILENLFLQNKLDKTSSKNGSLYKQKTILN